MMVVVVVMMMVVVVVVVVMVVVMKMMVMMMMMTTLPRLKRCPGTGSRHRPPYRWTYTPKVTTHGVPPAHQPLRVVLGQGAELIKEAEPTLGAEPAHGMREEQRREVAMENPEMPTIAAVTQLTR